MANNVKDQPEQTSKIVEFGGMATSKLINSRIKSRQSQDENNPTSSYGISGHTKCPLSNSGWDYRSSYQYHRNKLRNISTYDTSNHHIENFYHLLLRRAINNDLYPLLIHETRKLRENYQISLLWLLSFMNRHYKVPFELRRQRRNQYERKR